MTDGLPDRLAQLRTRWEADPASRIFLQLAEEYRHVGRVSEALAVLEAGLREHPGYLSALIAKGRCLLELGQPEAARDVLERVVKQYPTQMVANKLLVRAYLETGQHDPARERLDLYVLLHEADPEVEDLRRRIQGTGGAGAGRASDPPAPASMQASDHLGDPAGDPDPFSLLAPAPPPGLAPRREDDVFELDLPAAPVRRALEDVFELPPPVLAPPPVARAQAAASPATSEPAAPAATTEITDLEPELLPAADDPFPELVSRDARRRYLSALAAGGIFELGELAPQLGRAGLDGAAPAPAAQPIEDLFELELAPEPAAPAAPAAGFDLAEPGGAAAFELAPEPGQAPPPLPEIAAWEPLAEPELPEPEPFPASMPVLAPPAVPESSPAGQEQAPAALETATVTLGELYLRQGHLGDAERLFREVLRREPGNAAAQAALGEIARAAASPVPPEAGAALTAGELLGAAPGEVPGDVRARKVHLLQGYLARIRRGSSNRVP